MRIPRKKLKMWIAALDSGNYEQGRGRLQHDNKYCCLGVACRVLIPHNKLALLPTNILRGVGLYEQEAAPKWLQLISYDLYSKTGKSLFELNDIHNFTFGEIATILELVYIHKMVD